MKISAAIDKSEITKIERLLTGIKNGSKKAMTKALNKTANTTKTQITKKLGQTINLKAARIKKDFSVGKATYSNPRTYIKAVGKPIGLVNFAVTRSKKKIKARQHADGVSVRVYKGKSPTLLRHAFIAKTKLRDGSSKEHLFWRKYDGPRNYNPKWMSMKYRAFPYSALPKKYRLPVERLTGPRIEDVLAKDEILTPIEKEAADLLAHNLDVEAAEILRRAAL